MDRVDYVVGEAAALQLAVMILGVVNDGMLLVLLTTIAPSPAVVTFISKSILKSPVRSQLAPLDLVEPAPGDSGRRFPG